MQMIRWQEGFHELYNVTKHLTKCKSELILGWGTLGPLIEIILSCRKQNIGHILKNR